MHVHPTLLSKWMKDHRYDVVIAIEIPSFALLNASRENNIPIPEEMVPVVPIRTVILWYVHRFLVSLPIYDLGAVSLRVMTVITE